MDYATVRHTSRDTPDYSSDLNPLTDGVLYTCWLIGMFLTILRFYCRIKLTHAGLWWDDWMMAVGMVAVTVTMVLYSISLRHYIGHHIEALGFESFTPFLKGFWIVELTYVFTMTCLKASILFLYWRIFAVSARIPIIVLSAILVAWLIAAACLDLFQCNPVSYYWNRFSEGTCIDNHAHFLGTSIVNILLDFALLVLPLPYIFKLQMHITQRLLLMGIFAIGGFAGVVSIVRLVVLMQQNLDDPDVTYNLTGVFVWSILELGAGSTSASLSTIRPMFTCLKSQMTSLKSSRAFSSGHGLSSGGLETGRGSSAPLSQRLSSFHDSHGMMVLEDLEPTKPNGLRSEDKSIPVHATFLHDGDQV